MFPILFTPIAETTRLNVDVHQATRVVMPGRDIATVLPHVWDFTVRGGEGAVLLTGRPGIIITEGRVEAKTITYQHNGKVAYALTVTGGGEYHFCHVTEQDERFGCTGCGRVDCG